MDYWGWPAARKFLTCAFWWDAKSCRACCHATSAEIRRACNRSKRMLSVDAAAHAWCASKYVLTARSKAFLSLSHSPHTIWLQCTGLLDAAELNRATRFNSMINRDGSNGAGLETI